MPNEPSICNSQSFNYKLSDGVIPDLTSATNATFNLTHLAGTLPDITVNLRLLDGGIVNIKWTWAGDSDGTFPPKGKRAPYEVPDEFVSTKNKAESKD